MGLREWGYHVSEGANIIRAEETAVKCVRNISFGHEDWTVLRVNFPYVLEDTGEAGPELDYPRVLGLVRRLADRWGGWVQGIR